MFPLAATLNGITPVWASEIERAPIAITKYRFPDMLHLGDITKLNGGVIPAVDIISFGSPCQNLSTCGTRTGLGGEKSSLFFEAMRIINEMRDATNGRFPTVFIWENVMGAFSSSDRMDYAAVLSQFTGCRVSMPASGRWAYAGMVRGQSPDIAWRLMDAQYWSSPRLARRQRIFIVADLGGQRAADILFKSRRVQPHIILGPESRLSTSERDRGTFIETGGRIPVLCPFQDFRMRAMAKHQDQTRFQTSFGKPNDPFTTLLASNINRFAFWYMDDPLGGFIRYVTEREAERLMGLPEGWTKYGAGGIEISSASRYKALGNSIALPCANYIMAGIREAMDG